ncbi:hypothetical protein ACQPZX_15640 [Actinoplanes sp. CA-142083]|uniref:hypothetical protein n=1 Tax=Actinoplanes sp. CA-142083 TaxID=3239903 RepID=UPI003D93F676
MAAGVSVLLGVVTGVLGNAFTAGWKWPLGLGLGVAALTAACWEAWRATRGSSTARAVRTGPATAQGPGSRANSGVVGGEGAVRSTGEARASDGGIANSGIDGRP